jgi:hypothetical protein
MDRESVVAKGDDRDRREHRAVNRFAVINGQMEANPDVATNREFVPDGYIGCGVLETVLEKTAFHKNDSVFDMHEVHRQSQSGVALVKLRLVEPLALIEVFADAIEVETQFHSLQLRSECQQDQADYDCLVSQLRRYFPSFVTAPMAEKQVGFPLKTRNPTYRMFNLPPEPW